MPLRFLLLCAVLSALCPIVHATSVVPPQFTELVNGADYIVRAKVTRLSCFSEPRGKRTLVFTRVELEVLEVIAGTPPQPLVLTMLGGEVNGVGMRIPGAPQFAVGDEDVLFVRGNGRNFSPLYAVMHGRYPVKRDAAGREFVTRSNGVPLQDVAEVATPMTEGPAAQLQRQARSSGSALTVRSFVQQVQVQAGRGRIER